MSCKSKASVIKLKTNGRKTLIDLVQEHSLFSVTLRTSADYRNKLVTTKTWKKIVREMDVDHLDCK